jgi:hypothetical protein
MQDRLKYNESKSARKNRWAGKVETEEVRTKEKSLEALDRANSCRDQIRETLNKPDAYSQYKNLMNKMNNTCMMKLNKIEKKPDNEIKRYMRAGKRVVILPVAEKPKMTREEFKAWRSDRFSGS